MPVGEVFHTLIDSTSRIPILYTHESGYAQPSGLFVMQTSVEETGQSQHDPRIIDGESDFTYTFAHIPMETSEKAQEVFAQTATVFQRGESVGMTVFVYNDKKHIPVTAIRISDNHQGVDVLCKWPDAIKKEHVYTIS